MNIFKREKKAELKEVDRFVLPGEPEKTVTYEAKKPHYFRRLSDGTIQERYEEWDCWHTWTARTILERFARNGSEYTNDVAPIDEEIKWMIKEPIRFGNFIIRIEEVKD